MNRFARVTLVTLTLTIIHPVPWAPAAPRAGSPVGPPAALSAQSQDVGERVAEDVGTLLVAHGGSEEWNARVFEIADLVDTEGPVAVSILMGAAAAEHRFQDAVHDLARRGAERIVVVPVLASSHSGHYEQIRWLASERHELSATMRHHLEAAGIERPARDVPIRVTAAVDQSLEIAGVLSDRALALASAPGDQALFLVGHGPNDAVDYAHWMENLRVVADSVKEITGFRDVRVGLLRDDAPDNVRAEAVRRIRDIIALQHEATDRPVVVVPVLVSKGYISTVKLPDDLEGLPVAYDGEGLLPHPAMARWVERRVRETGAEPTAPAMRIVSIRFENMVVEPAAVTVARGDTLELFNDGDHVLVFEGNGLYPGEVAVSPGSAAMVAVTGAAGSYRLVDEHGRSAAARVDLEAGADDDPSLARQNAVGALTVLEGHVRAAAALHHRVLANDSPDMRADLARAGAHAGHPWKELLRGDEPDAVTLQRLLRESGTFDRLDGSLAAFVEISGDEATSADDLDAAYDDVLATVEHARAAIAGERYAAPDFRAGVVAFVLETAAAEYATSAEGGEIAVDEAGAAGRDDFIEYQDARAFVATARPLVEPLRRAMTPEAGQAFDSLHHVVFRTLDPPAPGAPLQPDVVRGIVDTVIEGLPAAN